MKNTNTALFFLHWQFLIMKSKEDVISTATILLKPMFVIWFPGKKSKLYPLLLQESRKSRNVPLDRTGKMDMKRLDKATAEASNGLREEAQNDATVSQDMAASLFRVVSNRVCTFCYKNKTNHCHRLEVSFGLQSINERRVSFEVRLRVSL